jgi:beta-glucosidase
MVNHWQSENSIFCNDINMKFSIIGICCLLMTAQLTLAQPIYKNASAATDERVADLLARMTLEEKIGQLCCPTGWEMYHKTGNHTVEPSSLFRERMQRMPPGSLWATLRADPWTEKTLQTGLNPELAAKALNALQRYALEETRLGIPLFFAEECPHGHMAIGTTVFPTSLAQAGTFNRELIREMAAAIGLEASLQGAHIGYGPILDVAREPRWSRMEETFGEDPLLTGILGSHFVQGLQGDDPQSSHQLYSTLKHFAAYGIPSGGHNGQKASIGLRELFSDHLEPFRMAIDAGAMSIMTSYNTIDGVPATASSFLLKELLRDRWGFQGFVFSDLGSIEGIAGTHRVAPDERHAAAMALQAGVDIDLGGNAYGRNLKQALEDNLISLEDIDRSVINILRQKFEMGLFEDPYVDPTQAARFVRSDAHKQIAREVARQGIVLLKNENGILPLSREIGSVAVIGPNADNMYNQLGDYTAPQDRKNIVTVLDGIRSAAAPHTVVRYARGCAIRDTTQSNIDEAVEIARASDVVVLVVGGSSARDFKTEYLETGAATVTNSEEKEILPDMESGEGYDRSTLHLLGDQEKLLNALAATGKPLIVIYIQGRPLNMNNAAQKGDALLTAWYPGQEGGHAIADILFGDHNPAGRLPVSVPRSVGQLPVYYALGTQAAYIDGSSSPLYAFGYGLSYTHYQYSDLTIGVEKEKKQVEITCRVTNTGNQDGDEVVQLYVRDNRSSVATPPIQLKNFRRIHIKKGESKTITFTLRHDDLALYNMNMQRVTEPGEFTLMIGAASDDIRLRDTFLIK